MFDTRKKNGENCFVLATFGPSQPRIPEESAVPEERQPKTNGTVTDTQLRQDPPPALPARPEHTKSRVIF